MLMNDLSMKLDRLCRNIKSGSFKVVKKSADPMTVSTLDTTAVSRQLATRFINQVIDESVLLSNVRRVLTDKPAGDLTKLRVSGPVTEGATENNDSGNTRRPTSAGLSYAVKKTRSAIDVTGEVVEDNIEGPSGLVTIMNAFQNAVANDMETLALEGDSSVSGSDDFSRLVKVNDGYNVLTSAANGAHVVNAGSKRFSYALSSVMKRQMPTKWKRNMAALRWIISYNTQQDYIDEQAARNTPFGDTIRQSSELPLINGIASLVVPLMPEDLTLTGTSGTTGTFVLLTDPKNLIFVVQRDLKVLWWDNYRKDTKEGTMYMRSDLLVEETDAVVKAQNVSVWTGHSYYS